MSGDICVRVDSITSVLEKQPGSKPGWTSISRSSRYFDLVKESHLKLMEFSISATAGSLYGETVQN